MWRVHGVLWLQNTKLIFPTFLLSRSLEAFVKTRFFIFLMKNALWGHIAFPWRSAISGRKINCFHFFFWRSLETFIKTRFFIFLMKKAFWWRVACYVRATGEKHDLGPAEHTVATRGLFDSTLPVWIHVFVFFCHDSCGRVIGFRDKTPFLSVFWGAADLTVLWGIICLKHKKTRSWNTQHVLICDQILIPAAGAVPPKKCEFVFRAITSSLFEAHKPRLTRTRRATPFRQPDR